MRLLGDARLGDAKGRMHHRRRVDRLGHEVGMGDIQAQEAAHALPGRAHLQAFEREAAMPPKEAVQVHGYIPYTSLNNGSSRTRVNDAHSGAKPLTP